MASKTKRGICCVMSLLLLLSMTAWSGATVSAEESTIQPRYSYTNDTWTSIVESPSGTAVCDAEVLGYSGITTRIHIKMELQKFGTVKWETVASWESTVFTWYSTLSKTKEVTVSGLYRVKVTYTVYGGSDYEIITAYSGEEFITAS